MKRVAKVFGVICVVTVCALAYVALEIELYRISYRIHEMQRLLTRTQDAYERMKIRVLRLKALDALEERVAAKEMEFSLPLEIRVVPLKTSRPPVDTIPVESGRALFSVLEWVKEAHATIASPHEK